MTSLGQGGEMRGSRAPLGSHSTASVGGGPEQTPSVREFFVRAFSGSAITSGCTVLLGFLTTAFLARRLGAAGYGTYAWAVAWVFALRIPAMLGMDRLLTRAIAAHRASGAGDEPREVMSAASRSVLVFSSSIAAGVATVALVLHGSGRHLTSYLALAMLILPVCALLLVRQAALLADQRVLWGLVPDSIIRPGIFLVVLVVAALSSIWRLTPATALLAQLLAAAVALISVVVASRAAFGGTGPGRRRSRSAEWHISGARIAASSTFMTLSSQIDLVLLGILSGPRNAGIYAVVTRVSAVVGLPSSCALPAIAPIVASFHSSGEIDRLQVALTKVARWVSGATVVGGVAVALAAAFALRRIAPGLETGASGLRILLVAVLISNLAGFNFAVLTLTGNERSALRGSVSGLVAGVGVAIVLIPILGVAGAALGALARVAVRESYCMFSVWRRIGIDATVLGSPGAVSRFIGARSEARGLRCVSQYRRYRGGVLGPAPQRLDPGQRTRT